MHKIKKDDLVVVIAGKDKDKQGKVISVDTKKNKILVQGCNMVTKHTKQAPGNPQGGIVNQEAPIDISNVMLVVDGKATRVGFEVKDGPDPRNVTGKALQSWHGILRGGLQRNDDFGRSVGLGCIRREKWPKGRCSKGKQNQTCAV